jgi:hypothetical protein
MARDFWPNAADAIKRRVRELDGAVPPAVGLLANPEGRQAVAKLLSRAVQGRLRRRRTLAQLLERNRGQAA